MSTILEPAIHPSLDNYMQFLRWFRGDLRERSDGLAIESDRREFTMAIPLRDPAQDTFDRFEGSILSLPWIANLDERLARSTRRKVTEIVFMSKPVEGELDPTPLAVRRGRSASDIEEFSVVQSRGFIEDQQEFNDWFPWLRAANLRNRERDECHFLLADVDGGATSVTLLLVSAGVCGIYAVATPPHARGRGLATALLSTSESIARSLGHDGTSLQVYANTYAHGFYGRRGFREEYRVGVWQ